MTILDGLNFSLFDSNDVMYYNSADLLRSMHRHSANESNVL